MKAAAGIMRTHNPFGEVHRASCLRENLTSSSYGEWLETGRAIAQAPRQSLTRQNDYTPCFLEHHAIPAKWTAYSPLWTY